MKGGFHSGSEDGYPNSRCMNVPNGFVQGRGRTTWMVRTPERSPAINWLRMNSSSRTWGATKRSCTLIAADRTQTAAALPMKTSARSAAR